MNSSILVVMTKGKFTDIIDVLIREKTPQDKMLCGVN